jgi:integrase
MFGEVPEGLDRSKEAQVAAILLPWTCSRAKEPTMAWVQRRTGKDGRPRYRGCYRDSRDRIRSAGTFATKKAAERAAVQAEVLHATGRLGGADVGKLTFRRYVDEVWFPHHVLEPSTREGYRYSIDKHLMPFFGAMKTNAVLPSHVREWVSDRVAAGVSPAMIRHGRIILSAIYTTALNDGVVPLHPCKGVKTPTVPRKEFRIVTPVQFDAIYAALPDEQSRLLVEVAIDSGLRWGELTELRAGDLDPVTRILTVSRAVVMLNPAFHPDGGRFHVKAYPKSKLTRRFKLSAPVATRIAALAEVRRLGVEDLLFTQPVPQAPPRLVPVPSDELGRTAPNERGVTYPHATLSAYTAGRCRCELCRAVFAAYRARRRTAGEDGGSRPRALETDGHLSRDWFTKQVWKPACTMAGIEGGVRMHDLRHAHASWLLAGGADLQVVKERLGHASIATTERYLHTLPTADDTALDALAKIRRRS